MDRIEDAFAFLLKLCCAALKKLAIQFFSILKNLKYSFKVTV
jgi:hypothetical protein